MERYLKGSLSNNCIIKPLFNDTGFTVLEMMMVMGILSIMATIAASGFYSILPDLLLKAAVRNLKSDLHLARLIAIRHHKFVVSEFNTANNSYTIFMDDGGEDGTKANNYSQDPGESTVKSVRLHSRINMFKAQFGSTVGKFAFNSRGTLDGLAGGVYMHNKSDKYRGVAISRIGKITIKNDVGS
jgi:prepilin-type N-terminal cleavage/methylation domain-containing protein